MAIHRLYPEKGTFIFSKPNALLQFGNAGGDPILEVGTYLDETDVIQKNRTLLQFNTGEIVDVLENKIETAPYSTILHMTLAYAENITSDITLEGKNIISPWTEGTGRRDDIPYNTIGTSWEYRTQTELWNLQGGDFLPTGSTQVLPYKGELDINMDITPFVESWSSGSNSGILLKLSDELESSTSPMNLCYYGDDTHTIFAPYLEFRWDDSIWTGSLTTITTESINFKLKNVKASYRCEDIVRFYCGVRPKYPTRTFTTGSIYTREYRLPENSYWGIKDEYSEEMIVPFSDYTKISADNTGSFFILDMNILPPERYYRLLVKTEIGESTLTLSVRENMFKVSRNG